MIVVNIIGNFNEHCLIYHSAKKMSIIIIMLVCCMVTPKIKGKSMPLSAIMHTVSLHRHKIIMAYCQFTQSDNGILSVLHSYRLIIPKPSK